MTWQELFIKHHENLLDPATEETIRNVESFTGPLPTELVRLLMLADGGSTNNNYFIIYSAGEGIHSSESILNANHDRPTDFPLLMLGRDASEEFGIKKKDVLNKLCPVYFWDHESESTVCVANSIENFARDVIKYQ
jgi:hypothetical protein